MREVVEPIEYVLDWNPEGVPVSDNLGHCCGVTEIGGFNELNVLLESMREQHENYVQEHFDWDHDNHEYVPHKGFKAPPEPTEADVVRLTKAYIQEEIGSLSVAYVATTIQTQGHAIQALEALKFEPIRVTGRVTLWLKRAQGIR